MEPKYNAIIQATEEQRRERQVVSISPLFNQLLRNAERNAQKLPSRKRHAVVMKKFATSLLIYAGPLAYNFIQQNMPKALPCRRTAQTLLYSEYHPIKEGKFRFDALLKHLECYGASKFISIGEDATRVISRVDYDSETDKLVGFVLPCGEDGLPCIDSFMAVSFESMEKAFHDGELAKYAFVYMAQSLTQGVPAFCLACLGTNNKFTAELVLKRWKYIFLECKKLGITVISFGADGDSRELKSMQVSTNLLFSSTNSMALLSPSNTSDKVSIPIEWRPWFAIKNPAAISYVQDIVHVAVKLKSRLIKPSILLPLGKYAAGVHHLRLVHIHFNKDEHGLRERDINHKDKQNYEAVLRMTSSTMFSLLESIPDAKGTTAYLYALRCVVDSYLDKSLKPLERIKKAWFGVFFMRYWRQWIVLNSQYTLGNNFITLNAYMCIELNAHSLLIFLLTLRKVLPSSGFFPWLLGSQSCEKAFRAARSMSSMFSTVINFGMLGLLRRLHRMHIQFCLESESQETEIKYPRTEAHKMKDGHGKAVFESVALITDKEIADVIEQSKEDAKGKIKDLGMFELLHSNNCWTNPPTPLLEEADYDDADDEDDQDEAIGDNSITTELLQEANSSQDGEAVATGISDLLEAGMITKEQNASLAALQKSAFKRVSSNTVPLFEKNDKKKHDQDANIVLSLRSNDMVWIYSSTRQLLFGSCRKMKEFLQTASFV